MLKFLSLNLDGPGRDTVLRDLKEKTSVCKPVFQDLIFEKVRKMYQDLMTEHNIKSALVEIAEDETSLVRHLTYCQKSDLIIGSCEPESPDHQCLESREKIGLRGHL